MRVVAKYTSKVIIACWPAVWRLLDDGTCQLLYFGGVPSDPPRWTNWLPGDAIKIWTEYGRYATPEDSGKPTEEWLPGDAIKIWPTL